MWDFFGRRKRFNTEVRDLLATYLRLTENELGYMKFYEALDTTWRTDVKPHEAALMIGYSHAAALFDDDQGKGSKFVNEVLSPIERQWVNGKFVSERLATLWQTKFRERYPAGAQE
jgi:hypothetical protein